MKKLFKGFIALAASAMMFCSCSGGDEKTDVSAQKLLSAALESGAKFEEMESVEGEYIKFNYDIEESWYEEFAAQAAGNPAFADEVIVVKAADSDSLKNIQNALNGRIEERKKVLQSYAPVEYDKLSESKVKTEGDYVYLVVGSDTKKAEKALEKLF
ncbi:MAG: DUF4358 domain-containing protein [Ruminococcus sp.]|nr:DUF4358 domain-containing protein [Ruminococcus sp.]